MLIEAIKHFFLSLPRDVKALGFGKEALAIQSRYKRCAPYWEPHLDTTKSEILKFADKVGKNKNIVILGSGNLLDIPFKDLAKTSKSLTLVDVIQLPETKSKVKNFPSIKLATMDATDFIEPFTAWTKNRDLNNFPTPSQPNFNQLKPDIIISLNLISQLVIPFQEYFEKHKLEKFQEELEEKLINNHINALINSGCPALIIGDISRTYMDGGKILKKDYLPENLNLPTPLNTWDWDIAPRGEVDLKISIRHKVGAWDLSNP